MDSVISFEIISLMWFQTQVD